MHFISKCFFLDCRTVENKKIIFKNDSLNKACFDRNHEILFLGFRPFAYLIFTYIIYNFQYIYKYFQ